MTDQELLEAAAKAAGYNVEPYTWSAGTEFEHHGFRYNSEVECQSEYEWNPLEDDGDALRLAVKLDMSVKQDDPNAAIAGWSNLQCINITNSRQGPWYCKEWLGDYSDDRAAATRRAIVRAAAEIGKKR